MFAVNGNTYILFNTAATAAIELNLFQYATTPQPVRLSRECGKNETTQISYHGPLLSFRPSRPRAYACVENVLRPAIRRGRRRATGRTGRFCRVNYGGAA